MKLFNAIAAAASAPLFFFAAPLAHANFRCIDNAKSAYRNATRRDRDQGQIPAQVICHETNYVGKTYPNTEAALRAGIEKAGLTGVISPYCIEFHGWEKRELCTGEVCNSLTCHQKVDPKKRTAPVRRATSITQPSYIQTTPIKTKVSTPSSNSVHEKCKDARDYQGCVNSFTGRSTASQSSDYMERQLQLQQDMLYEQRRAARAAQQREADRIEAERRRRFSKAIKDGFDGLSDAFNPKTTNCTSNRIGSTVYTNCH